MKGTTSIVMCDDDSGCGEWEIDYYEQGASNWRELLPTGWVYDPFKDFAFCPSHAGQAPKPSGLAPVHWVGDAPTSLHGNGATSFERTTRDPAGVTCTLCRTLLARTEPSDSERGE